MKKLLAVCLALSCLIFPACKNDEGEQATENNGNSNIISYAFDTYEDLIDVNWKDFEGSVSLCQDEKYRLDDSASIQVNIERGTYYWWNCYRSEDLPYMPLFKFNADTLNDINLDKIGQFSVDVYNASERPLYFMLMACDSSSYTLFNDGCEIYPNQWNNVNFNLNRLFYQSYTKSMASFYFAVYDPEINDKGATVYLDNFAVRLDSTVHAVDKTLAEGEILSFDKASDYKYVNFVQKSPQLWGSPMGVAYLEYFRGNAEIAAGVRIKTVGTDGGLGNASDNFNVEQQGFGFEVLPELLKQTDVTDAQLLTLDMYNDSSATRVFTVELTDETGKQLTEYVSIPANKQTAAKIIIKNLQGALTSLKIYMDTWNIADEFSVYVNGIHYGRA